MFIKMEEYENLSSSSDIELIKEISYGNFKALSVVLDRYLDLVSRTSFRILCDREGSESVTVNVFVSLWHDVMTYDDRMTLQEWLLRKTCLLSRARITRRKILRIFGVMTDVFVVASPKVEDADDYVVKQAWELYCRAASHMTPSQTAVFALRRLERIPADSVSVITGLGRPAISRDLLHAEDKIRYELARFGKDDDYERYKGFLRKVGESLVDHESLRRRVFDSLGHDV